MLKPWFQMLPKKRSSLWLWASLFVFQFGLIGAVNPIDPAWFTVLQNQHSLTLPDWGPYTKRYIGISHIPVANAGLRFDVSVFPGLYRRQASPPNVLFESSYHPWEATPDLNYFCFRHELEWKDQVYADISYAKGDDHSRLIRAECVNNTDLPQNLVLHLMTSMNFPSPNHPASVELPPDAVWVNAIDYQTMSYARSRPADDLVYDGKMRGEIRSDEFVNGSGLGGGFGAMVGDTAAYEFIIKNAMPGARLVVRYRMAAGAKTDLQFSGLAGDLIGFAGNGSMQTQIVNLGNLSSGIHKLTVVAKGGKAIELDGFAIVTASKLEQVVFHYQGWEPKPEKLPGPKPNSLMLKYRDADGFYGLAWDYDQFEVRQFLCKDLDVIFPLSVQNHVNDTFKGDGDGHYTDVFLRPITIAPHARRVIYGIVCQGSRAEVERRLAANQSAETCEQIYAAARAQLPDLKPTGVGVPFEFSQQRMAATLLCNVVYPVYTQRSYIKHYTPGKWWDSLYTWDSGFIGLGLAELDVQRSLECLNAYLTAPGAQSAFIHHGSMVPVQFYLFLDLWNRTRSRELLAYAYPRLKQYYEFYIGRLGSSTMGKFKSGVLSPFDYFYNSGGWDDYPPQKYTTDHKLGNTMAPVATTAHAIRIGKIMTLAAEALGLTDDVLTYQQDIASLTGALEKNSWDEASGYFGFLQHNEAGQPAGLLRYDNGTNFNMGMDGVYPLVAGIGTLEQTKKMLERLQSPARLWSRIGLSAVDQSAPYYRNDGYWNGTVWMPHQWFFWKTMLDLGEGDFAWQIAKRGLDLWKTEVDASYNCMEHFLIATGRGAGWHQFGALSTPVLKWYSAYCRPGTLTTGFNVWINRQQFAADSSSLEADLKFFPSENLSGHSDLVVCLNPDFTYAVQWNGLAVNSKEIAKGLLDIQIPVGGKAGNLIIKKIE